MPIDEDKLREVLMKITNNQEALKEAINDHCHDEDGDAINSRPPLFDKKYLPEYDIVMDDEIYDAIECEPEEEETDDRTTKEKV